MIPSELNFRSVCRNIGALLLTVLAVNLLTPSAAEAQTPPSADCSEFPQDAKGRHVIDGEVNPGWSQFSNLTFDAECTVRNFPASNPLQANFQFNAPGGGNLLIIFDNVVHDGNISCNQNDTHQHQIWYVNSISNNVNPNCRDLFIPVEKIDKASPGPTATIGVPFTYTMTIPVLFAPGGDGPGEVIDEFGSPNDLHGVTIWDDLNATGADLTYVDHTITWRSNGAPVPHSFSNANGFLTFEIGPPGNALDIPADEQFVVELTVVLNDAPANAPGTVFVNTAEWDFGRLIDDVFFEPLPGESGISEPMTVAAPQLIVTKTGPGALGNIPTLNLGQWGEFEIDVHNTDGAGDTGVTEAWNVTILDRLPNGPSGGMCELTPEILSAQIFAADGTTPVSGPLDEGTDFSMGYAGAPACELTLTMLSADAVIGPGEHLIVAYRTKLDPDTQEGVSLTNVAGAVEWFNDEESNTERVSYTRALTNGTPGVADHEDEHTLTTDLFGFFFEKSVANLTNGANPATIAAPGSTLRYTLRLQSTEVALSDLSFRDDLGSMNPGVVFVPGSLTIVSLPPGAIDASNPNGGTGGQGTIDIGNLSLDPFSELSVQFDITLADAIANGTVVTNQAELWDTTEALADSDDPNVNGQADPDVDGDEDPTRITIESIPLFEVEKISDDIDGDPDILLPGERLRYTITARNVGTSDATDAVLRDPIPENTTYVPGSTTRNGTAVADGAGGAPPFASGLLLSTPLDPTPGFMPADATPGAGNVATVVFEVTVDDGTPDGTIVENQGFVSSPEFGIVDTPSDDPETPAADDPTRDIVGDVPFLFAAKEAELEIDETQPGIVDAGDTLRYTITITNNGSTPATNVALSDAVPANTTYVANSLTLNGEPVGQPDGGVSPLVAGIGVSSTDLTPPVPGPAGGTISGGGSAVVEFLLRVNDGTAPGTLIINQATVGSTELDDLPTDGDGDPTTGPEPTVVVVGDVPIEPAFEVEKISADVDGDPSLLLAGERLRYTITVQNVGTADARDAMLRDPIPANTTYVPGSTTQNGTPVPDGPGDSPPFLNGMPLSTPVDPTPGYLPAGVLPGQDNVARVEFEVLVDPDAADGTIIANQGFVTSLDGGIIDQPSDDPGTPTVDDPTRDVVGSVPLLFAEKVAVLEEDGTSPGIVDPGDVLRYTIQIHNNGSVDATDAVLSDAVPNDTTYVADSLTLNGEPVGQPDGGVSPLVAGIGVSSTDLTPPLPDASGGTVSAGESAIIEFLLRVDDGTAPGTLIVNQATVESAELPDLPTDGDGNPATGPEPTVVVVGEVQQLTITKQVSVVGGGPALPGETIEYLVSVSNIGPIPAVEVVITDNLDQPVSGQLAFVDGSASMNGSPDGVSIADTLLTADYSAVAGPLEPGGSISLRFRAVLHTSLEIGTVVTNTADVTWNDPPQRESASVSVTIGGTPGAGVLSGTVWHDVNFDDVLDSGERVLESWVVELYSDGGLRTTALTGADGTYRISGLTPTSGGDLYELRFSAPGAGPNTAALGEASSGFTNGLQLISDIPVEAGGALQNLDLPIDPNGVVYNAAARTPIAGAVLTLLDAGSAEPLPSSCFDDAAQQGQVTPTDGYYKFNLNFSDAACPPGVDYLISVLPPSDDFIAGESELVPPASGNATGPFSVPACLNGGPGDAVPATALFCEATGSELAPPASEPAASPGTVYYLHLTFNDSSDPGSSQIFNNHIPLDPDLTESIMISKTSPMTNVTRGQLVPYVITVSNNAGFDLTGVGIVDRFPAGFKYVAGSARVDGVETEPTVLGRELVWDGLVITTERHRIDLLLAVGAGVSEGEFVNRAQVVNSLNGNGLSNEATATVRLVPDPDFDCTDVMGKVFNDANRNGMQDTGEPGIPGARVVTATGLSATTDAYGRYHITCATVPHEGRGSNFVLKLDDRTLPSGFRASKQAVQIARATRGKALRFNFGASIHRVIGLDVSDPIFAPGETELRPQWRPRIGLLIEELQAAPAVLRLSYLAETEDPRLVADRLDALELQIRSRWENAGNYELAIEPEVFWRLGAPPERPARRLGNAR